MPIKDLSLYGYLAAGVPGTVMGLDQALSEYGTLPRAKVMAPAIALARDGFVLSRADTDILDASAPRFAKDPVAAKIFLRPDGKPFEPGDRLVQNGPRGDARAHRASKGPDAFYKGPVAAAVEKASQANGGILTASDFAELHGRPKPLPSPAPIAAICSSSAPPPSSGGTTICEILNILEGYDIEGARLPFGASGALDGRGDAPRLSRPQHLSRRSRLRRRTRSTGCSPRITRRRIRAKIDPAKATPSSEVEPGIAPHEKPETTHYSVVDKDGNAVSVTYTINGYFGANVIAPGTGFFLNDEMDDFTVKPGAPNLFGLVQGTANAIAPGKRPLSSMAPTLVSKDGKVFLVLGSPGGSRIITIAAETIMNIVDHGMEPQEAVDAPRIHHQWLPDVDLSRSPSRSRPTRARASSREAIRSSSKPLGERPS